MAKKFVTHSWLKVVFDLLLVINRDVLSKWGYQVFERQVFWNSGISTAICVICWDESLRIEIRLSYRIVTLWFIISKQECFNVIIGSATDNWNVASLLNIRDCSQGELPILLHVEIDCIWRLKHVDAGIAVMGSAGFVPGCRSGGHRAVQIAAIYLHRICIYYLTTGSFEKSLVLGKI